VGSLERLAELVRAQGGLLASLVPAELPVSDTARAARGPAQIAASGPRAEGCREQYELLVEAIYEGYLLHYATPRVLRLRGGAGRGQGELHLLAGDRLYALGLSRLVALGDLLAVAELADLITISAQAQEAGDAELAAATWEAGARAIGWGADRAHAHAKALAFAGSPGALAAMRTSARA
jgi:hypothetical protein